MENNTPRITRKRDDRMIAGVASGLAEALDIPTWVVRLAFVVTTFTGGFGLAAYLVGLALMPPAPGQPAPADGLMAQLRGERAAASIVGVMPLAMAAAIIVPWGMVGGPIVLAAILIAGAIALSGDRRTVTTDETSDVPATV